jgi:hypothetical protein
MNNELKYGEEDHWWEVIAARAWVFTGHLLSNNLWGPPQFVQHGVTCQQVHGDEHFALVSRHWQDLVEWFPAHQVHLSCKGLARLGHTLVT